MRPTRLFTPNIYKAGTSDTKPEKQVKVKVGRSSIKKKTDNALGVLKDIADGFFRAAVKIRDNIKGYFTCPTCGNTFPIKEAECGHYVKRGENAVRWDMRNAAAQCNECNCYKDGRPFEFAKFIDKKYGSGTAAELKRLSKAPFKLSRVDLEKTIEDLKQLVTKK